MNFYKMKKYCVAGILGIALFGPMIAQACIDAGTIRLEATIEGKRVIVGVFSTYDASLKAAPGFHVTAIAFLKDGRDEADLENVCSDPHYGQVLSCDTVERTKDGTLQLSDVYRHVYAGLVLMFEQDRYGGEMARSHAVAFTYKKSVNLKMDQPRTRDMNDCGDSAEGFFPYALKNPASCKNAPFELKHDGKVVARIQYDKILEPEKYGITDLKRKFRGADLYQVGAPSGYYLLLQRTPEQPSIRWHLWYDGMVDGVVETYVIRTDVANAGKGIAIPGRNEKSNQYEVECQ